MEDRFQGSLLRSPSAAGSVRLVLLLRTSDVILFHHRAACGFFGGIGALLDLLEAVFRGGARGFLRLLRSKGGAEKSENRSQKQDALAYGVVSPFGAGSGVRRDTVRKGKAFRLAMASSVLNS